LANIRDLSRILCGLCHDRVALGDRVHRGTADMRRVTGSAGTVPANTTTLTVVKDR
jgi:hypothetical protein